MKAFCDAGDASSCSIFSDNTVCDECGRHFVGLQRCLQDGKQVYKGKSKSSGSGQAQSSAKCGRSKHDDETEEEELSKLEMGVWIVEIDQPMDLQKLRQDRPDHFKLDDDGGFLMT